MSRHDLNCPSQVRLGLGNSALGLAHSAQKAPGIHMIGIDLHDLTIKHLGLANVACLMVSESQVESIIGIHWLGSIGSAWRFDLALPHEVVRFFQFHCKTPRVTQRRGHPPAKGHAKFGQLIQFIR